MHNPVHRTDWLDREIEAGLASPVVSYVHVGHRGPCTRACFGLPPYRSTDGHAGEPCAVNAGFFVECPCDEGGCAYC